MLTIVFDLDGTLIDTAPDLIETLNFTLARNALPTVPYAQARPLIGGGARGMIERTFGLQVCPFYLSQFRAYENALETGQTAQELDPKGRTAAELETLYLFICEHVKKGDREHGKELASGA